MPDYARQVDPRVQIALSKQTNHACNSVEAKRRPGEYIVCGRVVDGRKIWDVYIHLPEKPPKLIGEGFLFPLEAAAFIQDLKRGKSAVVGMPGLRGRFKQAGRLLMPSADIAVVETMEPPKI